MKTYRCANCDKTMYAHEHPMYCPYCGANKKMMRPRRGGSKPKMTIEQRLERITNLCKDYDEKYKAFCLAYHNLAREMKGISYAVKNGRLNKDNAPKMPRINIVSDSRYFAEMEGKDNE